jgi:uncharacterized protein
VERADEARGRLQHQRLRRVLFRSRYVVGSGRRHHRTLAERLASRGIAVEARNQARVHLWYPRKHGLPYPELRCSTQGIDRFLTKNTQIGIRRAREAYEVYAPNGYDDVAALTVRPNPGPNFSAANYEAKAARWKALWPEITVLPADAVP